MKASVRGCFVSFFLISIVSVVAAGCGNPTETATDIQETGQQIGDAMASLDEAGGSGGSFARLQQVESARRIYARLAPSESQESSWLENLIVPSAQAAMCSGATTFSSCSNNVITRTFGGCTVGLGTLSGTVTLTFSDAALDDTCQLTQSGNTVTRVPNFTVTGRRGATLAVTKTGTNGQVITKGASPGAFTFTNDGIRRVFTTSAGTALFDFTTTTTSPIQVSGTTRANRTMTNGTLRVVNNLTQVSCDYTPVNVTWTAGCNCATSGTWTGTCSDGKTSSLQITSCGAGTLTLGEATEAFTFDRCYGTT